MKMMQSMFVFWLLNIEMDLLILPCCQTETAAAADQISLTQSQYTHSKPTSPSPDPRNQAYGRECLLVVCFQSLELLIKKKKKKKKKEEISTGVCKILKVETKIFAI